MDCTLAKNPVFKANDQLVEDSVLIRLQEPGIPGEAERQARQRLPGLLKTHSGAGSRTACEDRHRERVSAYAKAYRDRNRNEINRRRRERYQARKATSRVPTTIKPS
jgi:hypothetical protein